MVTPTEDDIMIVMPHQMCDSADMVTLPLAIDQKRNRIAFRFQTQQQLLKLDRNKQRKAHIISSALYCAMMKDLSVAIPKESKSTQTKIRVHPEQTIVKIKVISPRKTKDFATQTENEDIEGYAQTEENQTAENEE